MKWLTNLFKRDDPKPKSDYMVSVYDPTTKTLSEILASELTPNMVQAKVKGIEGTHGVHWIDFRKLKMCERQAESFPENIRDLIRDLKTKLDEVYLVSLEQWEDVFIRYTNFEQEIALWLDVADIYSRFTSEHGLSLEQKREYFGVLATCMNSSRKEVPQPYRPQFISESEVEKVIVAYYREKN